MDAPTSNSGDFVADPQPQRPAEPPSEEGVWRQRIATVLLVIFMVTGGLAVPAIWVRNQVLDTDRFVRTVAPLAENEDIQQAVAARITSRISTAVASSQIVSDGDGVVAAIVPMVTTAAVDSVTQNIVTSPEFAPLWEDAARAAHSGFQALLDEGDSEFYATDSGQVSIDLSPVVTAINTELAARGISLTLPTSDLTFVLFESKTLSEAQQITKNIEELAIILPVIALVALIGYILLSPRRRGAIVIAALGLAIMMAVILIFLSLARWLYLRELGDTVDKDAARATFDILTQYLRAGLRIIGLAALLIAVVFYLTLRRHLVEREDEQEARRSLYERWPAVGRFENAVATNRLVSAVAWTAIIVAILLIWDWQDIGWAIVLIVAGLAGVVIIFRAKPVPAELLAQPEVSMLAPASGSVAVTQSLQQLGDLRSQGLLSDDEFARAKATVLGIA